MYWNRSLVALAAFLFLFQGCKEDLVNRSVLRLNSADQINQFNPKSMHQLSDGQFLIYGTHNISGLPMFLFYDRQLELQRESYYQFPEVYSSLKMLYHELVNDKHLIAYQLHYEGVGSEIKLKLLDSDLRVEAEKVLYTKKHPSYDDYNISRIQVSKGGFLLAFDTTLLTKTGNTTSYGDKGIRVVKLDQSFEPVWEFRGKRSGILGRRIPYEVDALELENGDVFYHVKDLLPQPIGEDISVYGLLSEHGELRYQKALEARFYDVWQVGLSHAGKNVLMNLTVNDELLQYYRLYDPATGTELAQRQLPQFFMNERFSGKNRLPEHLDESISGHVLYRSDLDELIYQFVNSAGEPTGHFRIPTPPHDWMGYYRQCITREGTILVSYNLVLNGSTYFYIMEFDRDGNLLR